MSGKLERKEAEAFFRDYCIAKNIPDSRHQNEISSLFSKLDKNNDNILEWADLCGSERKSSLLYRTPKLTRQPSDPRSASAIESIFDKYAGEDDYKDIIVGEKFAAFCDKVGINFENWEGLALAWKMNSQNLGEISRDEFKQGCYSWKKADDMKKITAGCTSLKQQLSTNNDLYCAFYSWCFNYVLTYNNNQRAALNEAPVKAIETNADNCFIWGLLLRDWPLKEEWFNFLTDESNPNFNEHKWISQDLWISIFLLMKNFPNANCNWDEVNDGCFNHLIDEFMAGRPRS